MKISIEKMYAFVKRNKDSEDPKKKQRAAIFLKYLKDNNYVASIIQREKLIQESISIEMKLGALDRIAKTVVDVDVRKK
uniref:Uncharacterized protein n=1 Tax=viral metagenome TaxID=1070528 RepID=A0A6C0BEA0_9ZZZZ